MAPKILLYGAGGYSGRRVVDQVRRDRTSGRPFHFELLLGGRRADRLQTLQHEGGFDRRVFALDDAHEVERALAEPGLLAVINAAGPFAHTALPLARAAVRCGVHYVDLNGEADVYGRLDDLGYPAHQAGVALVSGAGHCAVTSDLMLEQALQHLGVAGHRDLGLVRIVYSHVKHTSRGSAQTAWRLVREQVAMVHERPGPDGGPPQMALTHVPLGQREQVFDFGDRPQQGAGGHAAAHVHCGPRRIATACSLLDLCTARLTAQRHLSSRAIRHLRRIEAYIEMPAGARIFVQLGALSAPLLSLPAMRRLVQAQVDLLPEGPTERERRDDRHTVLLQIEDACGQTLIDWRMETPDPYDFTAQCVLAVVQGLAQMQRVPYRPRAGWRTPAEIVSLSAADLGPLASHAAGRLPPGSMWAGCVFQPRRTA